MVTVVVILNVLISLLCLYVARQVWKLRRTLGATADALANVERNTYAVLQGAPKGIYQGQLGVHGLRDRYQHLELQLQQVQQVLILLGLIQRVGRTAFKSKTLRSQNRQLRRPQRSRKQR